MTHDVFISYSSQDKTVADAVCAKLESRKIRCWIAPRDVPAGLPYAAALIKAINTSRIVVLILSADSNKSVHVLREVGEAVDNAIPILPLRIEDIEPSEEMRYYIKSLHWLDALSPPRERHLEKLVDSVQALLEVEDDHQPIAAALKEEAVKTRALLPKWAKMLVVVLALIILSGVGIRIYAMLSEKSQTEATLPAAAGLNGETVSTAATSLNDGEWRTLTFNFADASLWMPYEGDGSYTARKQKQDTAFAWSDEIIEGDFTLDAEITLNGSNVVDNNGDTCIILVYGDGRGWSTGNLSFLVGDVWHFIEKDLPYHDGENWLAHIESNLDVENETYTVTIEIINDIASLAIDGRKILLAPIGDEVIRTGKIALEKFWDSNMGCTFSNIRVKTNSSN
jgi:hypothetical protein